MKKIIIVLIMLAFVNQVTSQKTTDLKGILELQEEYLSLGNAFQESESLISDLLRSLELDMSLLDMENEMQLLDILKAKEALSFNEIELHTLLKERDQLAQRLQKVRTGINNFEYNGISNEEKENVTAEKYSVPNFPALSFISSDVDNVSKPSSSRELATSLVNAIDVSGRVKQGLAIEFRPFTLLGGNINPQDYSDRNLKSILYDTQFSIGTVATSGDSTKTDLGWGIRITLLDNSNLMRRKSFTQKLGYAMQDCAPNSPDDANEEEELYCLAQKLKETKEYFENEQNKEKIEEVQNYNDGIYWNADWLTLSYAGGLRLNDSNIHEGSVVGHQVWIAGGTGFNSNWFLLSFQGKWARTLQDTSSTFLEEFVAATRTEIRFKAKIPWNLFAEVQYSPLLNKDDFENDPNIDVDKEFTWSAGTEFKVAKGFWAVVGIGENAEKIVGNDGIQLLTGLRMGILNKNK